MSKNNEFWQLADRFIELANNNLDAHSPDTVSNALLYAAAGFNAFVLAAQSESLDDLKCDKDEASRHYIGQYKRLLLENLESYEANYKELWPAKKPK